MDLLSPSGRLNRLQYFVRSFVAGFVFHAVVAVYFIARLAAVHTTTTVTNSAHVTTFSFTSPESALLIAGLLVAGLLCQWVLLVSQIKRLHDLNQSGWFVLLNLIPGAGFFLWLVLVLAKGNDQTNPYGLVAA